MWRTTAEPLPISYFFDRKTDYINITLRSPSGVEQTGTMSQHREISGFSGLKITHLYTLFEKEAGWSWKIIDE